MLVSLVSFACFFFHLGFFSGPGLRTWGFLGSLAGLVVEPGLREPNFSFNSQCGVNGGARQLGVVRVFLFPSWVFFGPWAQNWGFFLAVLQGS